jgi:hypothetical protein
VARRIDFQTQLRTAGPLALKLESNRHVEVAPAAAPADLALGGEAQGNPLRERDFQRTV